MCWLMYMYHSVPGKRTLPDISTMYHISRVKVAAFMQMYAIIFISWVSAHAGQNRESCLRGTLQYILILAGKHRDL